MKKLLLAAFLLPLFATVSATDADAQTRSRYPVMSDAMGKRYVMLPINRDGDLRKIYLDMRNCAQLTDRATCERMGMTPPPRPTDTTPTNAVAPPTAAPAPRTVVSVAMGDPRFSTLVAAIQAAGLAETLMTGGPYTVFAPTNEAFAELNQGTLREIMADRGRLQSLLKRHVLSGRYDARTLRGRASAMSGHLEQSMSGPLTTSDGETGYVIGGSPVIITDIDGGNGIIHVVNRVIVPPSEPNLRR